MHAHEQTALQRVRINVDLGVEDDGARALSRPGVGRVRVGRPGVGGPGVGHPGVGRPGVGHAEVGGPEVGYRGGGHPEVGVPAGGGPEVGAHGGEGPEIGRSVGRDDLRRVVDYEAIANAVRAIVAAGHVMLVETLAERIAESCLADPRVHLARVQVEKLDALADAVSVGVEIERRRADLSTH